MRGPSYVAARRLGPLAAGLVASAALTSGGAAAPGGGVGALETQAAALDARARSAALELYALETRLRTATSRATAIRGRVHALELERSRVDARLDIARRTLTIAQARLGERLRTLYERGGADPVAVVLGAQTLDEAVTMLEGMHSVAKHDRSIVTEVRTSRARLAALSRTLAARTASLRAAQATAEASVAALARARAERAQYVARLAAERTVTRRQLVRVERAAQTAVRRTAQHAPAASVAAPAADGEPEVAAAPAAAGATLTVEATGYALRGRTASGLPTGPGIVAVDPAVIPLGTRMTIPGYGPGVAADTGSAVRGAMIDLWFPSESEALAWGRRTVTITLHR